MQEYIVLKGCRENNLKNVSLNIPKRKITIFTGVSGSGKSSIVFETIGKESQRQLNSTFSAFVQNYLPKYSEAKADYIGNLSTPIIINQKRIGGNSRSTLGTITDINPLIRLLYSRIGVPRIPQRSYFSFNDIHGMCPECEGIGKKLTVDLDKILDQSKSLNEGAILLQGFGVDSWNWGIFAESGFFDKDKKIADYSSEELQKFLYGEVEKILIPGFGKTKITYEGLMVKFNRLYLKKESELSETAKKRLSNLMTESVCPLCYGARLNQRVLTCKIGDYNIAQLMTLQLDELVEVIKDIHHEEVQPVLEQLKERLTNLIDIGLGYLSLDRETSTLSGGESQRIKMVKYLNSNLVDLMYIFDEPSIGLHPRDVHKLNELLIKLRDKGNTVIVVEHDPDVIKIADHIVDVGPQAGSHGGEIMYEGSYEGLLESGTLTGNTLKIHHALKQNPRSFTETLSLKNCQVHNLKNVSVDIPLGILTVVTGVAGSGKSSLMKQEFMNQVPQAVLIDQSPVGANSRSNLATYSGIMDSIRKLFAKANDVKPGLFSYNSEGACENCKGTGIVETNLAFMDNVKTICEECNGKRYKKEVLEYHYLRKSIIEVLEMTVEDALDFFSSKEINRKLQSLLEMGIGYLTLGQPLDTLSGGECQRLKLANQLHKESSIYVMDEPTTGLHLSDISRFVEIINKIVDAGNTVILIEHSVEVIKQADWVIDLGPEAGIHGGEIIFEGTPEQLKNDKQSITSKFLKS